MPLHLEEHLEAATVDGSLPAAAADDVVEWRFDEPQPGWRAVAAKGASAVQPMRTPEALSVPLTADNPSFYNAERLEGFIYVDLPDLRLEDWGHVEVWARATPGMRNMGLIFNYDEGALEGSDIPFLSTSVGRAGLFSDGSEQTYRIPLEPRNAWDGSWRQIGLWFNAVAGAEAPSLEILSIRLVPVEEEYAGAPAGVQSVGPRGDGSESGAPHRRALFMHAPGTRVR